MKFLSEETVRNQEGMDIVDYTDCKSLEAALKLARSEKNIMLQIDLAKIKEKKDKEMRVVNWIIITN